MAEVSNQGCSVHWVMTRRTRSVGDMVLKSRGPCRGLTPFQLSGHCAFCDSTASSNARPWCPRLWITPSACTPPVTSSPLVRSLHPQDVVCAPHSKDVLDRFLPIQHQRQQRAQQILHLWARRLIHHTSLNVLRSEIRQLRGKCLVEPCSEHDDELCHTQESAAF